MFQDERIDAECGKIYSRGILLSVLLTLIYALSRTATLFMKDEFHGFFTYTEAVILILGVGILLFGAIRFHGNCDERMLFEKHTFYRNAGKVFVIVALGVYILTIPFTTQEMLGGQPHNHLLLLLESVGFLYLVYSFKTKGININYGFIAEDGWKYYSRVFMNIGALCLGLFPPFVLSASWALVLHESPALALAILLAYIESAIWLSAEYFFVSFIEKASYDTAEGERFALGTRISMLVCLTVEFIFCVLYCVYAYFVTGDISSVPSIGEWGTVIEVVSRLNLQLERLLALLTGLTVCHIISQIKKGTLLDKVCRIEVWILSLMLVESTLTPIWYRVLSEEALRHLAVSVNTWMGYISLVVSWTMWFLFLRALVKDLGVSRMVWTIFLSDVAVHIAHIFLVSQNMLCAATYAVRIVQLAELVLLTSVLWRYRGFEAMSST